MSPRRTSLGLTGVALTGVLIAGCGGGGTGQGPSAVPAGQQHVLRLAFFADIATADPDVFYDIEGDAVTQSVYDGLLHYAPNSTTLQGALASSWSVSSDGLTYSFHLRDAQFSDGSPVTSTAVKTSFERRTKINQGPAYMLADVTDYQTPGPTVFVVHLKHPVSDFLDLMASAWSPKIINPKVLSDNSRDDAQQYLKTNAAGTGPFMLTKFQQGTGYALTRNPHYWGPKPYFEQVQISIQPDVSSQELQLQKGNLDAILHGVPVSSLGTLQGTKSVTVASYPSLGTLTLAMNQNTSALSSTPVRQAVVNALNVPTLVTDVFGNHATEMPSTYPAPLLPPGMSPNGHPYDAAQARATLPKGLKLKVVYTPDSSGVERRFADLMRQRLAQFGVTVTEQQVQLSTVYGYRDNTKTAADIYISTPTPDAAAADAWARILWFTKGGLNFFNYSNPQVDAAINAGLRTSNKAQASQSYAKAGSVATADAGEVPIAQVDDVMAVGSGLTGVEHVPAYPWTLNLGALGRK